MSVEVV